MINEKEIVKNIYSNINSDEINKFLLLLNQLEDNETIEIGICTVRKISSFIFKVEDISIDFLSDIEEYQSERHN